jgi:hypothetical protein
VIFTIFHRLFRQKPPTTAFSRPPTPKISAEGRSISAKSPKTSKKRFFRVFGEKSGD